MTNQGHLFGSRRSDWAASYKFLKEFPDAAKLTVVDCNHWFNPKEQKRHPFRKARRGQGPVLHLRDLQYLHRRPDCSADADRARQEHRPGRHHRRAGQAATSTDHFMPYGATEGVRTDRNWERQPLMTQVIKGDIHVIVAARIPRGRANTSDACLSRPRQRGPALYDSRHSSSPSSVLNGVTTGAVYALIALGLTLIYGVLHIINFAHGAALLSAALVRGVLRSSKTGARSLCRGLAAGAGILRGRLRVATLHHRPGSAWRRAQHAAGDAGAGSADRERAPLCLSRRYAHRSDLPYSFQNARSRFRLPCGSARDRVRGRLRRSASHSGRSWR